MSSEISLEDIAEDRGIKYFLISFVDLLGRAAREAGTCLRHRRHEPERGPGLPASPPGST